MPCVDFQILNVSVSIFFIIVNLETHINIETSWKLNEVFLTS